MLTWSLEGPKQGTSLSNHSSDLTKILELKVGAVIFANCTDPITGGLWLQQD